MNNSGARDTRAGIASFGNGALGILLQDRLPGLTVRGSAPAVRCVRRDAVPAG